MISTTTDDVYRRLGRYLDGLSNRAPWTETLHAVLRELYTPEEAALIIRLPYKLSTFERVRRVTGYEPTRLRYLLDELCSRGLVLDLEVEGRMRYMVSPLINGFFEFTMMRTDARLEPKKLAELFHRYLGKEGVLYHGNLSHGEQVGVLRAIPYPDSFREQEQTEVLDFEKATAIVEEADAIAVALCACRREKRLAEGRECRTPLETCTTLGLGAEYLSRHGLARRVEKSEMLEFLARSRELGLVLCADNVRERPVAICHCCECCCNALAAINKFGYANCITSSSYLARSADESCKGCNHCEKACPVHAIRMAPDTDPATRRKKRPLVDETLCLGCGVCALKCRTGAMHLEPSPQRVLRPGTTFERMLLGCLERDTLQNLVLDNPESTTHKFGRALLGGFLRLEPVKRAIMSERLRSRFLRVMTTAVRLSGDGWATRL